LVKNKNSKKVKEMKKRSFHKKLKKLRINFGNKLKKLKRKEM